MSKRILVFFPGPLLLRHGGPYSVLYHLYQGLKAKENNIDFLSDLVIPKPFSVTTKPISASLIKKILKPVLPGRWIYGRRIGDWFKKVNNSGNYDFDGVDLSVYACLHFHTSFDLWRYQGLLKNYKGQIVLTSHSPKPYHLEVIEDALGINKRSISKKRYGRLEAIDLFAYNRADYLVFPCRESVEPYNECWPAFEAIFKQKKQGFLPTGIVDVVAKKRSYQIREELSIPDDSFVATFVGRKLAVKGFDMFIELAKQILNSYDNVYFVVVGAKSTTPVFEHPRLIETGWSDDPLSYVQASDLHIIPNRYANFDLNILECMALGKPLLLSDTGGNKFFKPYNPRGMFYHNLVPSDLKKQFEACLKNRDQLAAAGAGNRNLYQSYFTAERFADDHLRFYETIFS